ncbi:unnamed protein product [Prunus armeniaca]
MPAPLLALCQYVENKLKPTNKTITVHMPEEMFGTDHDTWLLSEDILQFASKVEIGATVIAVYMSSIKMYNSHTRKQSSRKSPIWKNLQGTPRQPTNVECGYYVMRFMRDIIHDPALAFEKKFGKKKEPVVYTQEDIDEVRLEWAEFLTKQLQNNN